MLKIVSTGSRRGEWRFYRLSWNEMQVLALCGALNCGWKGAPGQRLQGFPFKCMFWWISRLRDNLDVM
jgi:hypothetical protein